MSEINVDAIKNKAGTAAVTIDNSGNTSFSGSNTTLSGNLKVDTIQNTGGTTGLSINSTGRVTNPNKIAFKVIGNAGGAAGAYVTTSPIIPGTIRHNHGSGWDASTGRFTVPAGGAGLYWFHLHMGIIYTTSSSANGYPRMWIKNSSDANLFVPYTYWALPDTASYGSAHITATWDMAVGDYVYLTFQHTNTKYYADQSELSFEGYLIG